MNSDVDHRNIALSPTELIVCLHLLNAPSWLTEEVIIELSQKATYST
jgi:hypothetical protein